jgi:hypothetical protein
MSIPDELIAALHAQLGRMQLPSISKAQALQILRLPTEALRHKVLREVAREGYSLDQTRQIVDGMLKLSGMAVPNAGSLSSAEAFARDASAWWRLPYRSREEYVTSIWFQTSAWKRLYALAIRALSWLFERLDFARARRENVPGLAKHH